MTVISGKPPLFEDVQAPDGLRNVNFPAVRSATIRYIGDHTSDEICRVDPINWGVWVHYTAGGVAFIPWTSIGAIDVHSIRVPRPR